MIKIKLPITEVEAESIRLVATIKLKLPLTKDEIKTIQKLIESGDVALATERLRAARQRLERLEKRIKNKP